MTTQTARKDAGRTHRGHSDGSVQQIRPGVWRIRALVGYADNGSPRQASKTVHGSRADALRELEVLKGQQLAGTLTVASAGETVASYLARWDEVSSPRWSASTARRNAGQVKIITDKLGSVKLRDLNTGHLAALYAELTRSGSSAATVHRTHAVIRRALADAVRWGDLGVNVADAAKSSRPLVIRDDPRPATEAEARQIIDSAVESAPVVGSLLNLAACSGLSRSELCALRWQDVSETHITVSNSLAYRNRADWSLVPAKSQKVRRVPLTTGAAQVLDHLSERAGSHDPDAFVFSELEDGMTPIDPNRVSKVARTARDECGITTDLDPVHGLRAFVATVIGSAVSAREAQEWLGHASITTTERYLGYVRDDEAKAAGALDAAFTRPALPESEAPRRRTISSHVEASTASGEL
jgi:integrase